MKKIIILSTYCFEKASTNGLCAKALAKALRKQGHQVALVGYGDKTSVVEKSNPDGDFMITNSPENSLQKTTKYEAVKNLVKSFFGPVYDKQLADRYFDFVCQLMKVHNYDAIVSCYYPAVCMVTATRVKKEFENVKIFNYELDSVTDGIVYDSAFTALQNKANVKWIKKKYSSYDGVFIMKSHKEHVQKIYGEVLKDKLSIVDLPLLENKLQSREKISEKTVFLYAGLLDNRYRSPDILLNLFSENSEKENWQLHFYTKGNCENTISKFAAVDKRVFQYGYVSAEELDRRIENADVLISIGNMQSNSVPSKIITYMSYGKPIIHFSLQENDVCKEYLEKYPLALIIDAGTQAKEFTEKITEFVDKAAHKKLSFSILEEKLPMNLAEFSANAIIKNI